MTVYPFEFDGDSDIIRIDDNVSELAGTAINQLRDSMFAVQAALGITPQGSLSSVADRLDVSFNQNGTIKASALTSIGLATLPIVNNQVASNAAISESKLDLNFSTADLHTVIVANEAILNSLSAFAATTNADFLTHVSGGGLLSDGSTLGRHVASHIDLNSVPSDSRDSLYLWTGLKDKDGTLRSATHVAEALLQVNDDLVDHENAVDNAHVASAIIVDTSNFSEISQEADTVQKALDAIDDSDVLVMGLHRAVQHANGIPKEARSLALRSSVSDGYNIVIVPPTAAHAFLIHPPATTPQDSNSSGDDLIVFNPDNTGFVFDSQFSQVKPGDIVRMNYGGLEASYIIESLRYIPGIEWVVRVNGLNIADADGYARIDRPLYDTNTFGVLAVAAANNDVDGSLMGSVVVGHPRAASVLGLGFDANKLDSDHYKLYLQLYPTGIPDDKIIDLVAIDVTGNAGATPGQYTLSSVVSATNDALRAAGYNYRFIAFAHKGEFGISLADPINNAAFSIVSGTLVGASLTVGSYANNVIGDAADGLDALGLGQALANVASPAYVSTFSNAEGAGLPTKLYLPVKRRDYIVDGIKRDDFKDTFLATDGYWPATIASRTLIGVTTVETSYLVELHLCEAGLKPGKTIVVQPTVEFSDGQYNNSDYGRFIIKDVSFTAACGVAGASTTITVVNGVHASGNPIGFSSPPPLPVKLYFSEDSVSFNNTNLVDAASTGTTYNRFHEIYVESEGNTFSHERARLPKQTETGTLLNTTDRWVFHNVSPKLRGYKDDGVIDLNKYIRFYVISYDSATGEFDGYIGKRITPGAGIEKTGFPTRTRKNVPTKFYDETNIDYIELEFNDSSVGGVHVMTTNVPRYVDIELFPSLQLDQELFLLATCAVDDKIVKAVTDRREFGSVKAENFTTEAINFITAADRALHENGVVQGLIFEAIDPADSGTLLFRGGLAFVNGNVVAVNHGKVRIPEIRQFGDSLPATVDWAICVNETGQFVPIILTAAKTQFFATSNGVNDYYIPSVSFQELITNRKDLTLIYIATATINSIALSVVDARRFVANEGITIPFVWTGNLFEQTGHFRSLEQVKTWINNFGLNNNKVTVRGTFENVTEPMDLTGFTKEVVFEGDRAFFNITAARGFVVGSNVTLRNLTFAYNPSGIVYDSGNTVNTGNGCIYCETSASDVVIENCAFSTDIPDQMPPVINFTLAEDGVWNRISIKNNKFSTIGTTSQAMIAFTNMASGGDPGLARNVIIEGNFGTSTQGIYLTSVIARPGLSCSECFISKNRCGVIGVITSGADTALDFHRSSLMISENTCQLIANIGPLGGYISAIDLTYGTGDVWVRDNRCCWIAMSCINLPNSPTDRGTITIRGNHLSPQDNSFLTSNHSITPTTAIFVGGNSTISGGFADAVITENTTDVGIINGVDYPYEQGIQTFVGGIISKNIIRGLNDGGTANGILSSGTSQYISLQICDNQIYRSLGANINSFISGPNDGYATVLVVDNFFDFPSVDLAGLDLATVKDTTKFWVVERNKNQTITVYLNGYNGNWSFGDAGNEAAFGISPTATNNVYIHHEDDILDPSFQVFYSNPGAKLYTWTIPLYGLLPHGVSIISAGMVVTSTEIASVTGSLSLNLRNISAGNTSSTASFVTPYIANDEVLIGVGATQGDYRVLGPENTELFVSVNFEHSSSALITGETALSVVYRW